MQGSTWVAEAPDNTIGWHSDIAWENVSIVAMLYDGGGLGSSGTAYLTTSLGPGTSEDDEIARAVIFVPSFSGGAYTLFSGLNLGPGDYWLTVAAPDPPTSFLNWGVTPGSYIEPNMDPAVSYLGWGRTLLESYPPASTFGMEPWSQLLFEVGGTRAEGETPEPGSLALATPLAIASIMAIRRWRHA